MPILVDGIPVLLTLLAAFCGYKKGALATLISLVGGIAALTLALLLSAPVSAYISERFVQPQLEKSLISALDAEPEVQDEDSLEALLASLGAEELLEDENSRETEALAKRLASPISAKLTYAVTFIILFLLFLLAAFLLLKLSKAMSYIPILGSINRFLGIFVGLCLGLSLSFFLCHVFELMLPYLAVHVGEPFSSFDPDTTFVFRTLTATNPIRLITTGLRPVLSQSFL